jgi:hypothetical protein
VCGCLLSLSIRIIDKYKLWPGNEISWREWRPARTLRGTVIEYTDRDGKAPWGTDLGCPSAQPALVIALSERHTPRAQYVVRGDGVEIEVGQRKRKDQSFRREG